MSTQLDWAKLVKQNRVKAPGIVWTPQEMEAIANGVDPEDVRAGFLTKEEALAETGKDNKRVEIMKKAELIVLAKSLGINFNEEVVTRGDLIQEIKQYQKLHADKAE